MSHLLSDYLFWRLVVGERRRGRCAPFQSLISFTGGAAAPLPGNDPFARILPGFEINFGHRKYIGFYHLSLFCLDSLIK